jgi:hypothetical protein
VKTNYCADIPDELYKEVKKDAVDLEAKQYEYMEAALRCFADQPDRVRRLALAKTRKEEVAA